VERVVNRTRTLAFLSFLFLFGMMTSAALFQPCVATNDYTRTYSLAKTDGSRYNLTLMISQSLYKLYSDKGHPSTADRFVTPQVFSPVASEIRNVFIDDEDFANAVLMLVHQINYSAPCNLKYPVETLVDNFGDCDVFSVLAASVMKVGGLDVVLLEYSDHMNLGVYLQHTPSSSRTGKIAWYSYNGKNYYVAESTGGIMEAGVLTPWRVGEDSGEYSEATIISLANCDNSLPGQVTATLTLVQSPSAPTPLPTPSPTPPISIPPIEYELFGLACVIIVGWFLYRYIPGGMRKSTQPKSYENEKKDEPVTQKLPYDAWCVCPKCGAYISANIEYCPCGFKLPRRHEVSLSIQKIEKTEQINPQTTVKLPELYWCACPKCGAWIGIDTERCPFCNAILPEREK